ncbi:MAG: hypothetical protein HY080_12090 [Gammaproteobacteria bacterium]|nr:hypothetical protein [Gammaproteobacteria bacterium]
MAHSSYDEFYVIRLNGDPTEELKSDPGDFGLYLSADHCAVAFPEAAQFVCLETAEAFIRQWPDKDHHSLLVQYCTRGRSTENNPAYSQITQLLMEIPLPYRRSAYNWYHGKNVKAQLLQQSQEVWQRHYRFLLDFDIDLEKPSTVRLLPRQRKKIEFTLVATTNAPKSYFSTRQERPSVKQEPGWIKDTDELDQ